MPYGIKSRDWVDKMEDFKTAMVQYRAAEEGLKGIQKLNPIYVGYGNAQRQWAEESNEPIKKENERLKRNYESAKRNVLNLLGNIPDYIKHDNKHSYVLINGIPFDKYTNDEDEQLLWDPFNGKGYPIDKGIIEVADRLANPREGNNTVKTAKLSHYNAKQKEMKLENSKKQFISNTINPKQQEVTQKTKEVNDSMNINALYKIFLKLLKNLVLPKNIGSYKKGSIFVGLTNDEYNINGQIDRLLEYIQRNDAEWASYYFLTLINNIEEHPSFKALYNVLMKDDVLEFLFETIKDVRQEKSKLSATHYKSILKVLKIVIENSTSLKPDIKKTIIAEIDNLSNFEDLNSKEANLDKSTSNLVKLQNKIKTGNLTPLTNHSNVAVQNLSSLPKMNEKKYGLNNKAIKSTLNKASPGTTLGPKVAPTKPKSWFGFGGRVSKKRTRKQSKQSKRSKRIQTRRR